MLLASTGRLSSWNFCKSFNDWRPVLRCTKYLDSRGTDHLVCPTFAFTMSEMATHRPWLCRESQPRRLYLDVYPKRSKGKGPYSLGCQPTGGIHSLVREPVPPIINRSAGPAQTANPPTGDSPNLSEHCAGMPYLCPWGECQEFTARSGSSRQVYSGSPGPARERRTGSHGGPLENP